MKSKPTRVCGCGAPIHPQRLLALPDTTVCIDCAKKTQPTNKRKWVDPNTVDISQASATARNGFAKSD